MNWIKESQVHGPSNKMTPGTELAKKKNDSTCTQEEVAKENGNSLQVASHSDQVQVHWTCKNVIAKKIKENHNGMLYWL